MASISINSNGHQMVLNFYITVNFSDFTVYVSRYILYFRRQENVKLNYFWLNHVHGIVLNITA